MLFDVTLSYTGKGSFGAISMLIQAQDRSIAPDWRNSDPPDLGKRWHCLSRGCISLYELGYKVIFLCGSHELLGRTRNLSSPVFCSSSVPREKEIYNQAAQALDNFCKEELTRQPNHMYCYSKTEDSSRFIIV